MSSEADLRGLLDREAIRQLPIMYCHYVRMRDIDGIVALYSPDCVFENPPNMSGSGIYRGPEGIRKVMDENLDVVDPWPFTHNHVIEITGPDTARGFVYAEFRMGSQNMRATNVGVYADEYVRVGGEWKFHSRKLTSTPIPA